MMYEYIDLPFVGVISPVGIENAMSLKAPRLYAVLRRTGQVTKQVLRGSHVSLGRLRHSPSKLGRCIRDVVATCVKYMTEPVMAWWRFWSSSSRSFPSSCSSDSFGLKPGVLRGLHSLMPNLSGMDLV